MNCSTCKTTVDLAIRAVRGLVRTEASLVTGRARVEASATVPALAIISAIEKAGYSAVAAESAPSVSPGAALASALFRARQLGRRRSSEAVGA